MSFKRWIDDWIHALTIGVFIIDIILVALWKIPNNPDMVIGILLLVFTFIGILHYGVAVPTILPQIATIYLTQNIPHTRVIIRNVSRFPARVYINLNPKLNGKLVSVPPIYRGAERWQLFPKEVVRRHFEIKLNDEIIKAKPKLTMSIQVWNAGFSKYILKYPTANWHFDFEKSNWYNDDFGYYA